MSFDNDVELRKVAAVYPEAQLLLRVVCEDCHERVGSCWVTRHSPFSPWITMVHGVPCGAMWCHVPGHSLMLGGEDSTAQCPMSLKFGAKSSTWRELLRMIQELKLNLTGVQQPKTSGLRKESTDSDLTLFDMIQHDSRMSKRERESQ